MFIITVLGFVFYFKADMHEGLSTPYPYSTVIKDIDIAWPTHIKRAPGSDNWPLTWADDNHQYSSWGDGGGFEGTNARGRVSLGFARIEGGSGSEGVDDPFKGVNIFGGFQPQAPSTIDGKSYGILSVDGLLYAWISPGSGPDGYQEARLYQSPDHARSWQPLPWSFTQDDGFIFPTFLQFGRNYSDSRDDYVYVYASILQHEKALSVQKPGHIALLRVPIAHITKRERYEAFTGLNQDNMPEWSTNLTEWQPVFSDPNGVGWNLSVSFNQGLKRYFLVTEHHETSTGQIGIFDSNEPWGPWTTSYYGKLGSSSDDLTLFYYNFSNKWLSQDGIDFVLIFTGTGKYDAYNSVEGNFVIRD